MKIARAFPVLLAIAVLAAAPLWAQTELPNGLQTAPIADTRLAPGVEPSPVEPEPEWGITEWGGYSVGPCDAFKRSGGVDYINSNCEVIYPAADGSLNLGFPVHLPQGALMQYTRIYYSVPTPSDTVSAGFYRSSSTGTNSSIIGMTTSSTVSGNQWDQFGPFSETVDNEVGNGYTYFFLAILSRSGGDYEKVYKMHVYFKLQISPAPGTASFTDVPTSHWAFQFVEALKASGITVGCNPPTNNKFCPESAVTRAEMATFLARALGLNWEF